MLEDIKSPGRDDLEVTEESSSITPSIDDIIKEVKDGRIGADTELIRRAYEFACEAHKDQKRKSGEPYIIHPISVAMILAKINADEATIAAGFLHDTVEDTSVTLEDISKIFSPEIAKLVDGVTKLENNFTNNKNLKIPEKIAPKTKEERQAENLRKIFLAMADDIRVILIKLADRLHNMRTLQHKKPESQKRIANETLTVYASIASRLGIFKMKWELEDLSFSYLNPDKYAELKRLVNKKMEDKEELINRTTAVIKRSLGEHSLKFIDVKGRRKHLYSTWKKITERNKDFSEIYDLFAIRIIVQEIKDCYGVLGVIHGLWIPMEDRVKDYISKPKSNGYKSIHTTVYVEGEPMEIQIRTLEMHMVNEFGPAAHWAYKEHRDMNRKDLPWLRRIAEWQKDSADAESGVRNALEDANEANIYVCTPKGDLIDIAPGSTPIDFAYIIHTDVGHKCVGAKVNSSIVPLTYRLQLGDMVEIITSNTAAPKLGWLQFCRTSKAKEKIRQWFKKEKRPENISRGRELIIDELRKASKKDKRISESVINDEELMSKAAKCFNYSTSDDMIASIGYSETPASKIVQKLSELLPDDPEKMLERKKISSSSREELGKGVKVPGMENFMIVFAKCCNPIPGDSITGMLKFGTGISIHRKDCRNVREERCFHVEWTNRTSANRKYPIKLEMEIWDRYGVSAECISIINEMRVPLKEYNSKLKSGKDIIIMSIEVCNKEQLDIIIRKLSKIKGMISVSRTSGVKRFGRRGM